MEDNLISISSKLYVLKSSIKEVSESYNGLAKVTLKDGSYTNSTLPIEQVILNYDGGVK